MAHALNHTPEEHQQPDQWHRHSPAEPKPQHEHAAHVNTAMLSVLFVVIVVFVVATVAVTIVYFNRYIVEQRQARIETTALAQGFWKYRDESRAALAAYSWTDAKAGKVAIPIETAKQKVIATYGGQAAPRQVGQAGAAHGGSTTP